MDKKEVIFDYLGEGEIFCQLAEEAAELAQAAINYYMGYMTPTIREEAYHNLIEEVADVTLCLRMLKVDYDSAVDESCEITEPPVLCRLAKEAADLSKAAMKCRRAYGYSRNVTPVTKEEAYKNLVMKVTEVMLCLRGLGLDRGSAADEAREIMGAKIDRWYSRLYKSVAGNVEVSE